MHSLLACGTVGCVWGVERITACAKNPGFTDKARRTQQKHILMVQHGVMWQKRRTLGSSEQLPESTPPLLRFIDFMLEDWCRCRAETTALLCWCNILPRNKHQPGCQHKRQVLFKAASFKGEGLELARRWSTVMGEFKCSNYLKIEKSCFKWSKGKCTNNWSHIKKW